MRLLGAITSLLFVCAAAAGVAAAATLDAAPGLAPPSVLDRLNPLPPARNIDVPGGFRAGLFARGLRSPTAMAFGPDGRLYVTEEGGRVVVVRRGTRRPAVLAGGLSSPLGLAWSGRTLFVSARGTLVRFRLRDGALRERRRLLTGLPVGQHQQNNVVVGRDRRLYLGSGSTCDACSDPDPRSATILSLRQDGSDVAIVARGIRNPFGLAVDRRSGDLYATVNAVNQVTGVPDAQPAETLVKIVQDADYGWPECWPSWADRQLVGECDGVTAPVAYLEQHSSADGIAFNLGPSFPARYRAGIFVALWGQYGRFDHGRRVEFVALPSGEATPFATGFAHPLALAVDAKGALLVADWERGTIVRIQRRFKP